MEDTTVTAALVAVIMVLYKVIEFFISKYSKKISGDLSPRNEGEEAARQARETYEHVVFTVVPELKLMSENQKEIVRMMKDHAATHTHSLELLQKITVLVNEMEQRMVIEDEVQKRLKAHKD